MRINVAIAEPGSATAATIKTNTINKNSKRSRLLSLGDQAMASDSNKIHANAWADCFVLLIDAMFDYLMTKIRVQIGGSAKTSGNL